MEISPESCNVKVALHIRPLLRHERQNGGVECLDVVPGTAQVLMGSHSFIFDHVYGAGGSPSDNMFEECAVPLLDALFQGYNSTVIAYGQTGSGKTYTMGTNPKESSHRGLMFLVMNKIFNKIEALKHQNEFQLHVSFIEILKEEVRDLLDSAVIEKEENNDGNPENAASGKQQLQIRKASDAAISLGASTEVNVATQKEMTACLEQGCSSRSVASTDMNNQSSRSHAIFTIILEQKDKNKGDAESSELMGEEYRCAKLHLVDLAGSERAKRAGSEGVRLKEGIQINKGLLALGNVISALGDDKKRKEGLHIPYRDSKLTRLLQASLGGNCKTVMIACVSPADYNAEETLNTLKYANRARNIQNKASVQKEVFSADTHKLRQQLRLLQAEIAHRKEAEIVEMQDLKRKIDSLETTNSELAEKFNEYRKKCTIVETTNSELLKKFNASRKRIAAVEASNSQLLQKINEYRNKSAVVPCDTDSHEDTRGSECTTSQGEITESATTGDIATDIVKEPDKMAIKQDHEIQENTLHVDLNDLDTSLDQKKFSGSADVDTSLDQKKPDMKFYGSADVDTSLDQKKPDMKFSGSADVDTSLDQKKPDMKFTGSADVEALKQQFAEKIIALEEEKRSLQLEIGDLRYEIKHLQSQGERTENDHQFMDLEKPEDTEIADLERKHEQEIEVLKQKNHDAIKKLQDEVRFIKSQKVQLQQKVKQEEEQFRQWKANHEKQMIQVKKDARKTEFELNKVNALYLRQTQVCQRKTEEAARAAKKLKEVLESRKVAAKKETTTQPSGGQKQRTGQAKLWKRWLNNEVDKVMQSYKLRMDHERKTQALARFKEELSFLKQQEKASKSQSQSECESQLSPNARAARIVSLESRVKSCTTAIQNLSTKISEAGKGQDHGSAGRWKMLNALGDAKDLLQHLFNIVIEARCRLLEKGYEIKPQQNDNTDVGSSSTQTASVQKTRDKTPSRRPKETEEQNTRDNMPSKKLKELEEQVSQNTSNKTTSKRSQKGKGPATALDLFADIGIEPPLSFPESRQVDSRPGICNRPLQVVYKQTQKMVPIEHVCMKKLPLGEQKGKLSRWRRSHDEWLLQFKWKWQKPWKLSHSIRTSDQIRNSDETLKGQDVPLRLASTSTSTSTK